MANEKTMNQIMAVILEEINGYSRQDAIKLAPDYIGHPVYERIVYGKLGDKTHEPISLQKLNK